MSLLHFLPLQPLTAQPGTCNWRGVDLEALPIPPDVEAVFRKFRTCEFATLARDGTPIVWPTEPLYLPERTQFLITASIGMSRKAENVRRNPRVSLLFSNPTGSGLAHPPAVLVQGDAVSPDEVYTWNEDLEIHWRRLGRLQPASRVFSSNPVSRYLMDWLYMRLLIYITPRHIRWWPEGDFSRAPKKLAVGRVG